MKKKDYNVLLVVWVFFITICKIKSVLPAAAIFDSYTAVKSEISDVSGLFNDFDTSYLTFHGKEISKSLLKARMTSDISD